MFLEDLEGGDGRVTLRWKGNTEMELRKTNGTVSGSYLMAIFGSSGVEPLGSATTQSV
jgi:hypothetical protein